MGFLAPAVPWIVKGGAALAGSMIGKKSQQSAMKRSPEEAQALQGAQGAAMGMQQGGQKLIQSGQGAVQQGLDTMAGPAGYWSKLLGGNRAAMSQATAGAKGSITDIYRGAERGLERSNVRGAQRDVAKAELGRDRAGKIAGLTTGVQPYAAESLAGLGGNIADIGTQTTGQGANLSAQGGNIWGNLLGEGRANRQYGRAEGEKAGGSIGSFLFDILSGSMGGRKGGNNSASGPLAGFKSYWS